MSNKLLTFHPHKKLHEIFMKVYYLSMKSLFDLLQNYKPPEKTLNPRASLIKEFVDEINKERVGTKYKEVSAKCVAIKLGVLKTNDELHRFLAECKDYKRIGKSFSQRFFGGFRKHNWK